MKQVLLFVISLTLLSCNAPKNLMQEINKHEVIDAPGMSRVQLFSDINSWMAEHFVSRENVIQFQDKETGKIIGRFIVEFSQNNKRDMTLQFDIKDESFRMSMKGVVSTYKFSESTSRWYTNNNPYYEYNPDEVPLIEGKWNELVSGVVEYINNIDSTW